MIYFGMAWELVHHKHKSKSNAQARAVRIVPMARSARIELGADLRQNACYTGRSTTPHTVSRTTLRTYHSLTGVEVVTGKCGRSAALSITNGVTRHLHTDSRLRKT